MSHLRKQLDALRREYRCAHYPGDLAAEVLPRRRENGPHGDRESIRGTGFQPVVSINTRVENPCHVKRAHTHGDGIRNQDGPRGVRRPGLQLVAAGSLVTGLAAAVVLWIGTRPHVPVPKPVLSVAATQSGREGDPVLPVGELSIFPSFPDDLPLVPSGESTEIGSMPSMPSLDFSFSDAQPKEST